MNADASVGWSFVCLFPLIVLTVLGLLIGGGVLLVRAARRCPMQLRPAFMIGVPGVVFLLGFLGTMFLFRGDDAPPLLVAGPIVLSVVFAGFAAVALSRWAFPQWWGAKPAVPNKAPEWWRRMLLVIACILGGLGLLGVLFAARVGHPYDEAGVLSLFALIAGGLLLLVAFPVATPRPTGQPPVSFWRFAFSKSGALIFLGGVGVAVVVAVVTEKHDLAKLIGSAFIIGMVWWRWSRGKVTESECPPEPVVAPLLLTPDPVATPVADSTPKRRAPVVIAVVFGLVAVVLAVLWLRMERGTFAPSAPPAPSESADPAPTVAQITANLSLDQVVVGIGVLLVNGCIVLATAGFLIDSLRKSSRTRSPAVVVRVALIGLLWLGVLGLLVWGVVGTWGGGTFLGRHLPDWAVITLFYPLGGFIVVCGVMGLVFNPRDVLLLKHEARAQVPFALPVPTTDVQTCPTCFSPIPADSPHGLCPRCLIRGAMPSPSSTRLRPGGRIEPPSPAEVNEFFPHLEVLELIGAGGMGAVYTARQPILDRVVALKIVQSPRGDEDPVFAERFAREARAMAKLDHPNIVTIHESGEAGGLPFLLMEYVDGVTLREAMVNRLLTTTEALAVIPQVCDALDFAHRHGVVHRDIKPENILIDQTGRVKIADFGLAKLADPKNVTLTRTQQAMGTPHYMAPEQWERPNDVDHRADVYALGVVLYELLTGELPLGRFALPSEKGKGDAKLDLVVIRALAKDPNERYQNAGQMKAALSGVKLAAFTPAVPPKRKGFAAWVRGFWPL